MKFFRRLSRGLLPTLVAAMLFVSMFFAKAEGQTAVPAVQEAPAAVAASETDSAGAESDGESTAETIAAFQEQLNALLARYDTLGACVCIIENGEIAHTFCYGTLTPGGEPVSEDTMFRVGSISKMVTAMGMMQLVETGAAQLDEDISVLLGYPVRNPAYPETPVTLRQVMSHTAGLRDSGFYSQALRGRVTALDELFSIRSRYLFFGNTQPGAKWEYSNFGGGLLGAVLESLTGETVDDYMSENVFAPLGVVAVYQGALLPPDRPVADMYAMPSGRRTVALRDTAAAVTTANPLYDYTLTAGKLTLSAPDLAKLAIALCDGGVYGDTRVLKESSVAMMLTPQNNIGSVSCQSGWGLDVCVLADTMVEGRTLYGHGGKANGMLCAAYFDPTDRTGVVMLTNGCNNTPMVGGVGELSVLTVQLCYAEWIDGRHTATDPWLVEK
ncbi:MAG: beta-lactamase family protein [Eubacteriales bacterium]|nr:beta-lactamase family protein [Eubacteriales bacterium]